MPPPGEAFPPARLDSAAWAAVCLALSAQARTPVNAKPKHVLLTSLSFSPPQCSGRGRALLGAALGLCLVAGCRAAVSANPDPGSPAGATATNRNAAAIPSHPEPSGAPAHGPAWRTFRHPTGLSMRHPPDWQLRELPSALLLVPPNPATSADGPDEAYLVAAEGAEGITAPDDPRLLAYLDQQLAQLAPFLRRAGTPEKVDCATAPGALVRWEGRNPKGDPVQAEAYAAILKGYGVVLFAIGKEAPLAGRKTTLRQIFSSFAAGEGEKDPQVVGRWKFWSYSGSVTGNLGTERSRLMVLRPDGTCTWASRSETSGTLKGGDSLGNETWVGGIAGTTGETDTGTWSAGNGRLFVQWKDGSMGTWSFRVSGASGNRRLHLTGSGTKPDEWVEVP